MSRPLHEMESRWQEAWEREGVYLAQQEGQRSEVRGQNKGEKFYGLIEFPYPSGDGLHVGHPRPYVGIDVVTRKRRMEGKNVLYPIGWDAFGLPTENFAIKQKIKPADATKKNIATFTRQIKSMGFGFDWSREVNTTDPAYYKWTQWQFLQFLKHGLAYKAKSTINWCPKDKIGLANEEAQGGVCERCGTPVEKREKEQWMIRITDYAERLLTDLDTVDYLDRIKTQQINWIGKSEGAEIAFQLSVPGQPEAKHGVKVFTTRPDTLFGATFLVVSPEVAKTWLDVGWQASSEVRSYVEQSLVRPEMERGAEGKEKTGVDTGVMAINPANKEAIPVWVADYVLGNYGTGAIMAVPAHDERDHAFAKKFGLPITQVVAQVFVDETNPPREDKKIITRRTVECLLRRPSDGAFLCLTWRQFGWNTFIIGGVDDGESYADAAVREVREETGYQNVRIVRMLGEDEIIAKYFAAHKNENRTAVVRAVLLELENETRLPVSPEETAKHEAVWVPADQVRSFVRGSELHYFWPYLDGASPEVFTGEGENIHSDFLDGLPTWKAKEDMISWLEEHGCGQRKVTYKLRDWVFSRQRYWGEPIPIVICKTCGYVAVPDDQLPVVLPDVEAYEPTDTGESPLAKITDWVNTTCPKCGGPAKRETDTMPNWAGSSWYFLRYCDPHNDHALADPKRLKYWMPVDLYNGGMEHTTLHLLYSRFWYKFLWDIGVVPKECGSEPYRVRRSHGLIMAPDGQKMSKSRGNVVNPDEVIATYGADALRVYEMFMGPFDQPVSWDTNGIEGVKRFLDKVWNLFPERSEAKSKGRSSLETLYHQTVKKVTEGIDHLQFNTCVSQLMILTNALDAQATSQDVKAGGDDMMEGYLKILAPFAPHITEEIWRNVLGHENSIHRAAWPAYDPNKLQAATFELVVQVNGKVRDRFQASSTITEEEAKAAALASEKVQIFLAGKSPSQVVYVKGRLVNVVVT